MRGRKSKRESDDAEVGPSCSTLVDVTGRQVLAQITSRGYMPVFEVLVMTFGQSSEFLLVIEECLESTWSCACTTTLRVL
jgi:hypothetical protein